MTATPLLDWTPPEPKGDTYDPDRDGPRLAAQARAVLEFCLAHDWVTLRALADACGAPEASVSARLRDLRRAGFQVERQYVARGLHKYRVRPAEEK
jgi:hypothetical protein